MPVVSETLGPQGFPFGVIHATDATLLPPTASPRGLNSALASSTQGVPFVQKRKGLRTINRTPISGSPALTGLFNYRRIANNTDYLLLFGIDGSLSNYDVSTGTLSSITTSLSAGDLYPDFETANDLCFMIDGTNAIKYDGTSVTNFGITRPTVGTMAGAAGAAGLHNGTYELRVTYGNSDTGAESSASDTATTTVTVANQAIDWSNIPVSPDAQVDRRYLYVRNIATQTQFFRVGTVMDNVATTATTSVLDANATIKAPSTTSRNPPPTGVKFLAYHQGRMFVADDTNVYWSELDAPEAFSSLSVDGINKGDGEKITGLVSDHEVLLVLKEHRVYGIFNGNNPTTWQVRLVSADTGCASHRTIVRQNGWTLWWSPRGLVRWDGSVVDLVGLRLYGSIDDTYNTEEFIRASAAPIRAEDRYIVAVPSTGQVRATRIIPFNVTLGVFEATYWDPMDAAVVGEAVDASGASRAWLGNYAGQLFRVNDTNADGIAEGATTGTWVATGTSVSAFTNLVSDTALDTTGAGLIERKVSWFDADGEFVSETRRYITANTADSFTLSVAVDGFTVGQTYTWVVGGPDFQWDTPWRTYDAPWIKKRYTHCLLLVKGLNYGASARLTIAFDYDDANANGKETTLNTSSAAGTWDSAIWDQDVWDVAANVQARFRVGRVGFAWRVRLRNSEANQPFAMLKLGMDAAMETEKR